MTIRKVHINIGHDIYLKGISQKEASDYAFEVNYINEYISRMLAKQKISYRKVTRLLFYIESDEQNVSDPEGSDMYCFMTDRYADYSAITGVERIEKTLQLLTKGAQLCEEAIPGITDAMLESAQAFREGGYRNEWLFKKRRMKDVGTVKVIFELTREAFHCYLAVENKEGEFYRKELMTTLPDPICYHHEIRKLDVTDEVITILDHIDRPRFQITREDILSNRHGRGCLISKEMLQSFFEETRNLCRTGQALFDVDAECRWSYFFADSDKSNLIRLGRFLETHGYDVMGFLEPEPDDEDQETIYLRADRIETHTLDSLYERNNELYTIVRQLGAGEYDGMDVGAVELDRTKVSD